MNILKRNSLPDMLLSQICSNKAGPVCQSRLYSLNLTEVNGKDEGAW